MDAHEYLSRKGVALDRDQDRPNTLEEKAWERAREAGDHRPKAGTPHDWEDWEHHHDELAEDAASLEQKIDRQAHRQAEHPPATAPGCEPEPNESTPGLKPKPEPAQAAASAAVGHFTPPAPGQAPELEMPVAAAEEEPAVLNTAYAALAVLFPPLAVGLSGGGGRRVAVSIVLTLLLWVPGIVYAIAWLRRR
ncbi:MAG: YqaE/Pmp3 family membrane protein [Halomonas subglaciescola]|nr:YqaE/Pmp3 family membrane protein [Halomonas subglaciescola]